MGLLQQTPHAKQSAQMGCAWSVACAPSAQWARARNAHLGRTRSALVRTMRPKQDSCPRLSMHCHRRTVLGVRSWYDMRSSGKRGY